MTFHWSKRGSLAGQKEDAWLVKMRMPGGLISNNQRDSRASRCAVVTGIKESDHPAEVAGIQACCGVRS